MRVTIPSEATFCGSHLIDGCLYTSHLYNAGGGYWDWVVRCIDIEGDVSFSTKRRQCEDINCAFLWVLSSVMEFGLSLGVEPDQLQIIQRGVSPDADPEFIALVLRTYHDSLTEIRH